MRTLSIAQLSSALAKLRRRLTAEGGFTIIELVCALTVLTIGIFSLVMAFDSSRKLSLVSERHTTLSHVAQREIENLEGLPYSQIALNGIPASSTNPDNPDHYVVGGSPPTLEWNQTASAQESLITPSQVSNGSITPVTTWQEGQLSGLVYDFVTWTSDPTCGSQCPASGQDYKRIVVAVTMNGGLQPDPIWLSSVIADPSANPSGKVINGSTGNPLDNPSTKCLSGTTVVPCSQPLDSGTANIWFLHDFSSWSSGSPQAPSADHSTHCTVNVCGALPCNSGSTTSSQTTGCPQPDLMDTNAPTGDATTPCYKYSSEQSGTPGCGRVILPVQDGSCTQGNSAFGTLSNTGSEFWVTPPLTSAMALTGAAGLTIWTQTAGGANAIVTYCAAIYDVPPSGGTAGSLANILSWPPTYLGAGAYTPPTDTSTGTNWPASGTEASFAFTFASSSVTVPTGHRIGLRVWASDSANVGVATLYDNPLSPSQLQVNSN
jgi:hypothetical protein